MLLKKRQLIRRKNFKLFYRIYEDQFHRLADAASDFIVLRRQLDDKLDKFKYQDHMYKLLFNTRQDVMFAEEAARIYSNLNKESIIASEKEWDMFAVNYYKLVSANYKMQTLINLASTMEVEELKIGK